MSFEEDEDSFEHTLLIVREVHVYKIPPRMSSGGYKCSEWLVSDRIWSGRLRLVSFGDKCEIRLEDTKSGELFAACPVIPGKREVSIENVLDSSRYFVLRIDDGKGHRAFVGLGFNERSESFDFNVAISDYEKHVSQKSSQTGESSSSTSASTPSLNLKLKEGETIRINMKTKVPSSATIPNPNAFSSFSKSAENESKKKAFISPLAPPPGDIKLRKSSPVNNETNENTPRVNVNSIKHNTLQGNKSSGNFIDVSEIQKKFSNLETNEKGPSIPPASGWAMF